MPAIGVWAALAWEIKEKENETRQHSKTVCWHL
jgi:hypothetical protein